MFTNTGCSSGDTGIEITNPAAYPAYSEGVPASIARHGGRFLVRGGAAERLEGDWQPGRLVVIEFPSLDALHAWYRSPEYQELAERRRAASRGSLVAVEGASG